LGPREQKVQAFGLHFLLAGQIRFVLRFFWSHGRLAAWISAAGLCHLSHMIFPLRIFFSARFVFQPQIPRSSSIPVARLPFVGSISVFSAHPFFCPACKRLRRPFSCKQVVAAQPVFVPCFAGSVPQRFAPALLSAVVQSPVPPVNLCLALILVSRHQIWFSFCSSPERPVRDSFSNSWIQRRAHGPALVP
jgi:hypothetical protein